MPKINVYLPEDLAAAVKRAGIPVSPVCQQALAEAVRSVAGVRKVVEAIRDRDIQAAALDAVVRGAGDRMTGRLKTVLELAARETGPGNPAGSGRLLLGLLDEGSNLATSLIRSLDVDVDDLRPALVRACSAIAEDSQSAQPGRAADQPSDQPSLFENLTWPARSAIAGAIEAAVSLGHNYVGTEHLLLGLLDDPDSQAGRTLRERGLEAAATRRALTSALAGYAHGRHAVGVSSPDKLAEITWRLKAIESRLTAIGA